MTVNSTDIISGPYLGNNIASSFSYSFAVKNKTQLNIYETDLQGTETLLTVDTDYTVNNIGDPTGGTIDRLAGALPAGWTWYIRANYPYTQETAFSSQGAFFPQLHESAIDKLTYLIQQLKDMTSRALRFSDSYTGNPDNGVLPEPEGGTLLGWDPLGLGLMNYMMMNSYPTNLPLSVATVADLRLVIPLYFNQQFNLLGYTVAGKGGGLVYYAGLVADTSSDNGVTTFVSSAAGLFYEFKRFAGEINAFMGGAIGDGVANDTLALQRLIDLNSPFRINAGTYLYETLTDLDADDSCITGDGSDNTTLKCTVAGIALTLGNTSSFTFGFNWSGLTIEGNAATTDVINASAIAFSQWRDIVIKEANNSTGVGLRLRGCMLNDFESIICSSSRYTMTNAPYEGLNIEALTPFGNCTNNTFKHCYFEGSGNVANTVEIGARLSGSDQNLFLGGAMESCGTWGLLIGTNCRMNTFISVGFENLDATGDFGDAGISSKFINCYSSQKAFLQGRSGEIDGGLYESILIDSLSYKNKVNDVLVNGWNTGSGGFVDNGVNSVWESIYNKKSAIFTGSTSGSVLTVTAVASGVIKVGQDFTNIAGDLPPGLKIIAGGTGTGGTGTYNLSSAAGTTASAEGYGGAFIYPYKDKVNLTLPASGSPYTNDTGEIIRVIGNGVNISAATITRGSDTWNAPWSAAVGEWILAPGDQLTLTYGTPLTKFWAIPMNGFQS